MSKTKLETLIIDMYLELINLGGNECSTFIFGPEVITVVIRDEPIVFNAERIDLEACKKFAAEKFPNFVLYDPSDVDNLDQKTVKWKLSHSYNESSKNVSWSGYSFIPNTGETQ